MRHIAEGARNGREKKGGKTRKERWKEKDRERGARKREREVKREQRA